MADKTPKTSLRTVINQVTKEKLAWLDIKRQKLRSHFQPILEKYELPENRASLQFLREVHATLKACIDSENPALDKTKDLTVFLNWIRQDDPDEVIYFGSSHLVRHWIDVLVRNIKFQIERCEYSCLYANVMTQYMDVNSPSSDSEELMEVDSGDTTSSGDEKTDKEKTIEEFCSRIFREPSTEEFDKEKFKKFLDTVLFHMDDPIQKHALLTTRNRIRDFSKSFHLNNTITQDEVKQTIDGLLAEDLLGSGKATTLKELSQNDDALHEVTTLLNNRFKNFSSWTWPEPVYVDFRRNMAGRYRAYMDEDIISALFLHYVGARWAIEIKQCFMGIYKSKMWKRGTGTVGDLYYHNNSIEGFRREFHANSFLSILPSKMQDLAACGYDDERKSNTNDKNNPIKIKQKLLHLISNEIQLNQILRPETPLTVAQTDMEWFGPSIVHEAVYCLFEFFDVNDEWIQFFRRFLECPLRVGVPTAPVQKRRRGVPMSHMLSNLFGEILLFTMDLYVNQKSGLSLYRIHDDFWFWGHDQEKVKQAWEGINEFVQLSGLKLNEEKSTSVICHYAGDREGQDAPQEYKFGAAPLPQRKVKWGFLLLHSDGIFRISEELLESHVQEMRDYLQKQGTIMGWVHCHNKYIKFFIRNFAEPAITFGRQHIVQIMKTLHGILKKVHKEAGGDTVGALKLKFADVWGDKEVMDSWVHWPVQEGGLSLFNPFLDLIPLHEAYRVQENQLEIKGFTSKFGKAIHQDEMDWTTVLQQSKNRRQRRNAHEISEDDETVTDFDASESENEHEGSDTTRGAKVSDKNRKNKRFGFETWCKRGRETQWQRWKNEYSELLKGLEMETTKNGNSWRECMYQSQFRDKLGIDSGFIDTNLIPLSLINSMQDSRVHKD